MKWTEHWAKKKRKLTVNKNTICAICNEWYLAVGAFRSILASFAGVWVCVYLCFYMNSDARYEYSTAICQTPTNDNNRLSWFDAKS